MKPIFLAGTVVVMTPLFPPQSSQKVRLEKLSPFFQPAPGQMATVDYDHTIQRAGTPKKIKGFIRISPPKKSCFTVQRHPDRLDLNVCESKKVAFSLDEINDAGQVQWTIYQSLDDSGTQLSWPTPYRHARMIPLGEFENNKETIVTIKSCKPAVTAFQRKINLELMDGTKWTILFPDEDTSIKNASFKANLYVRVLKPNEEGGASLDKEYRSWGEKGRDPQIPPPEKKLVGLAAKLSGEYKNKKTEGYKFSLDKPGTFVMSSGNFLENNAPKGLNGKCLYRYQDAPGDPKSGVIECFETEAYDVLYTHIPCARELLKMINENEKGL